MIKDAISFLVDEAPKEEVINQIKADILACPGVIEIDDLKVRKHMEQLYVDVEIAVDNTLNITEAHEIAEYVHHDIEDKYDVIHCMVHVNPVE